MNNRKIKKANIEKYFWETDWILSQESAQHLHKIQHISKVFGCGRVNITTTVSLTTTKLVRMNTIILLHIPHKATQHNMESSARDFSTGFVEGKVQKTYFWWCFSIADSVNLLKSLDVNQKRDVKKEFNAANSWDYLKEAQTMRSLLERKYSNIVCKRACQIVITKLQTEGEDKNDYMKNSIPLPLCVPDTQITR